MDLKVGSKIISAACLGCGKEECALTVMYIDSESISLLSPEGDLFEMPLDDDRLFDMVQLDDDGDPIFN